MKTRKEKTVDGRTVYFLTPENEADERRLRLLAARGEASGYNSFGDWKKARKLAKGRGIQFALAQAKKVGDRLLVDWDAVDLEQFRMGLGVEMEHRDITGGNLIETAKIVLAHLKELPDYYTRLGRMEKSRVRAHQRIDKRTGRPVQVREYTDKRVKKSPPPKGTDRGKGWLHSLRQRLGGGMAKPPLEPEQKSDKSSPQKEGDVRRRGVEGALHGVLAAQQANEKMLGDLPPKLREKVQREPPGHGREIKLTKNEVTTLLKRGVVGLVSAGRNPEDPEDKDLPDAMVARRHEELRRELIDRGFKFQQALGKYGQEEASYFVMVPAVARDELVEIGEKFRQDSVIFSDHDRNEMIFTTGPNKFKYHPGSGFRVLEDEAADYYTELKTPRGRIKFSLNFEFDKLAKALGWLLVKARRVRAHSMRTKRGGVTTRREHLDKRDAKSGGIAEPKIGSIVVAQGVAANDIAEVFGGGGIIRGIYLGNNLIRDTQRRRNYFAQPKTLRIEQEATAETIATATTENRKRAAKREKVVQKRAAEEKRAAEAWATNTKIVEDEIRTWAKPAGKGHFVVENTKIQQPKTAKKIGETMRKLQGLGYRFFENRWSNKSRDFPDVLLHRDGTRVYMTVGRLGNAPRHPLIKAHVRGHSRRTPKGAVTQVRAYTDRRVRRENARAHLVAARVVNGKRRTADGKPLPKHLPYIPPAWTDVHYSPDPGADLLVTGLDEAGKLQYIYSKDHKAASHAAKFAKMQELARNIAKIKAENEANLSKKAVREEAACLKLIMATAVRPGSEERRGTVQAYGATTLEGRHVVQEGQKVFLRFVGKKGVHINIEVRDKEVAAMLVSRAKRGKNKALFKTDRHKLRLYAASLGPGGFLPKDFRTFLGTTLALREMKKRPAPRSEKEYRRSVNDVGRAVAARLGNTFKVALANYINPAVFLVWRSAWSRN